MQGWVLKILSAERFERIFGCPCGWRGRPGQCVAFRPRGCDFPGDGATRVRLTAWSSRPGAAPGRYGGHRTRPVTGAAGRGSSARRRASARRARRKLPHPQRRAPALTPAAYGGPPWPLIPPPIGHARFSRFTSRPSGPARRRCALEAVEKVVTTPAREPDIGS